MPENSGSDRMWEFLGKVLETLPSWFVMALIVFLAGAALYILPRLRRDKNGKLYLYSRSYEYQQNRFKGLHDMVLSVVLESFKHSFYLELLPEDERLIAGLKFVYSGGNGRVREDVARFVKEHPDVYRDVITRYPQWALPQK
jgi:hypothetical protein